MHIGMMYTFYGHTKHGSVGNNSKQVSLTPAAQCRARFEPCDERRLAEQKSPVLTAQTTQPASKNWPLGIVLDVHGYNGFMGMALVYSCV